MESNNVPVIAKRVWHIIRVAFFMLRKGISKGKLTMELNMLLKRRRKLAGKAISNLMALHHNHHHDDVVDITRHHNSAPREYEFSCSKTPNNFFSIKRHRRHNLFTRSHAPDACDEDTVTASAVNAVLEMLNNEAAVVEASPSPALPGFGRSPYMVRQLRVTDSPFPVVAEEDKDNHVDKAAEEFIKRFYTQLRKQD